MKDLSTPKKRLNAPAALALGAIIVLAVGLVAIGFYIGSQGDQHSRMPQHGPDKVAAQDYGKLQQELTQGRINLPQAVDQGSKR